MYLFLSIIFLLSQGFTVSGRLIDSRTRKPWSEPAWVGLGEMKTMSEAGTGRFSFANVPAGRNAILVCCGTQHYHLPWSEHPFEVTDHAVEMEVLVTPDLDVRGRVIDATIPDAPDPLPDTTVTLRKVGTGYSSMVRGLDYHGTFHLRLAQPGEYKVEVSNSKYVVRSMRYGSKDISGKTVFIEPTSQDELKIVVVKK
jgi:hypothetical protein